MATIPCPICGAALPSGARFCASCGRAQTPRWAPLLMLVVAAAMFWGGYEYLKPAATPAQALAAQSAAVLPVTPKSAVTLAPCGHAQEWEWEADGRRWGRCVGGHVFQIVNGQWQQTSDRPSGGSPFPESAVATGGMEYAPCPCGKHIRSGWKIGNTHYGRCANGHAVRWEKDTWVLDPGAPPNPD